MTSNLDPGDRWIESRTGGSHHTRERLPRFHQESHKCNPHRNPPLPHCGRRGEISHRKPLPRPKRPLPVSLERWLPPQAITPQHERHRGRVESDRQAPTVVRDRPVFTKPHRTVGGVS